MERLRSNTLLFIYDQLKEGKVVKKNDILNKFEINERTFYRYIKDIKNFIEEESNGKTVGEELIADRYKEGYILKGKHEKSLDERKVLAISKVLLESRGFAKREMKEIIGKLLDNCASKDKESIEYIIGNEFVNYIPPKHGKNLLERLWQISNAINDKRILEIGYSKLGADGKIQEEVVRRTVEPKGLLFSEYYFYLIAFIEGKGYKYPTIYRVDRIKELIPTDRTYKEKHNERFQDGEFRKLIQFMQTGELERIQFKFRGTSIEAVLDRLPNANVVKEKDGEYIVNANMFGKGIKMWLLSQGSSVEVLSPKQLREDMIDTIEKMVMEYK